jgi:hypothetical protein
VQRAAFLDFLLLLRAIKSLTELHLDDSSLFAFNALSLVPMLQVHFHTLAGGPTYMFSRLLNIVSSEYQKCLFFARGETAKALFLAPFRYKMLFKMVWLHPTHAPCVGLEATLRKKTLPFESVSERPGMTLVSD